MFDFLKKKISQFTEKVKDVLQKKAVEKPEEKIVQPISEKEKTEEEEKSEIEENIKTTAETLSKEEQEVIGKKVEQKIELPVERVKGLSEEVQKLREEKGRELKAKTRVSKQLTSFLFGGITIEEKDVTDFLWEFELSLLEADVEQETAQEIVQEIKKELIGKKLKRGEDLTGFLKKEITTALIKVMGNHEEDLFSKIQGKKPFVILMLGPNGAGKTTTIAKLTHLMQKNGKKVVLASADTFRAGSIEQIEVHAKKLNARVIKHSYGSDPAAVAFDAVKAAEASKADIVLIDSAGRQETNKNLMQELQKINRVVKPDLKIFVGEALSGNALLEQATKFNQELGLDGFILTKIDTDAKGGTSISLLYKLDKPIFFVGIGQHYDDLVKFSPEFILKRIIS